MFLTTSTNLVRQCSTLKHFEGSFMIKPRGEVDEVNNYVIDDTETQKQKKM